MASHRFNTCGNRCAAISNRFLEIVEFAHFYKHVNMQFLSLNTFEENNELFLALSNWTASITCSHRSYSGGVASKYLTYTWKWEYAPSWTLTDKVAMAWSGDFTVEPNTIYWTYKKNVGFTGSDVYVDYINENGYGYDDYNPNAGCAKGINIRGTIAGTYNRYHTGTLSAQMTKVTSTNSRESAIGRYYHQRISLSGLSLSFSKSGPSIGVSAGFNYDQSSDSATAFWATSNLRCKVKSTPIQ